MDTIINGLSLGSIWALIAIGYTMVYGIVKLINFAHGEVIMIGAFASYFISQKIGATPLTMIVAIIFSIIVCALTAYAIEKLAYKTIRERSTNKISSLITAIGVSYFLFGLFNIIVPEQKSSPKYLSGLSKNQQSLMVFIITILMVVLLTLFVMKTKQGKAMRALSENKIASNLVGINSNKIISLTFMIGAALAAIGAVAYSLRIPNIKFDFGTVNIGILPFVAAVIGGIGSLPGAVLGGYIIGMLDQYIRAETSYGAWTLAIIYGILIVILLVKPSGILGKNVGEKV